MKTLSQVHANHYVAFTVDGYAAAFANKDEAYMYARIVGLSGNAVKAVYRY